VRRPTCPAEVYTLRDENTEIRDRDSFRRFDATGRAGTAARTRSHRRHRRSWAREPAAPLLWVLRRVVAGLERAARWTTIPHVEPMNRWPK
jgi:hypothetical protein